MMIDRLAIARAAFAFEHELCKAELRPPRSIEREVPALAAAFREWLAANVPAAVAWARRRLADLVPVSKAVDPLDFADLQDLYDAIRGALGGAAAGGARDAGLTIGVDLSTTPAAAQAYAEEHAADLVGRKLVAGQLIGNPNPEWAISEILRDDVRDAVSQAIAEGWSPQALEESIRGYFGPARAEAISRTELGFAYGEGAAAVYHDAGVGYVMILDGAGCMPDGHDDAAPAPSGTPGLVEDGAQADGQIWTVEQYQQHLLGHPNCVRAAVAWKQEAAA